MMTGSMKGTWTGERDEAGHRTYCRSYRTAGPPGLSADDHLKTPGLPKNGDRWEYNGETDVLAVCQGPKDPPRPIPCDDGSMYEITFMFSTRPAADEPVYINKETPCPR